MVPRRHRLLVCAGFVSAGLAVSLLPAAAARVPEPAQLTTAAQAPVTPPDLVVRVPKDAISIGRDGSTGDRMLHFSHLTSDVGLGPFEIDPAYNPATGVARFSQVIYRSPSAGQWVVDHRSPVPAVGVFHPPSDYDFPVTSFTLLNAGGKVVARSPKSDYCITGDYRLSGVPNTPPDTFISPSNCSDPTARLGWSVGWADEYDQTDAGQPIDLRGVPNGTYTLRAIADPEHVFYESDTANDVTDTVLTISGTSVTVGTQTHPRLTLPSVAITSPAAGASSGGAVTVSAAVSAPSPASVRSVQFLLDGEPLGAPVTSAPYRATWQTGASSPGAHELSARVTDTRGIMNTARPVTVRLPLTLGSLKVDRNVARTGTTSVTTKSFSTSKPSELLLAFAGADGPLGQRVTVSGAGLSWTKVRRANGEPGDAEIWQATAAGALSNAAVTARAATTGYHVRLNVVALIGASGTGATVARSAVSGAPKVTYTATKAGSIGFAVGNDWDNAVSPVPGSGQTLVSQLLDSTGDTYWTQAATAGASSAGSSVTLGDSSPTGDRTNFAAVEVLAAAPAQRAGSPAVTLVDPTGREVVSGTVPVAAQVTGPARVRSVTFRVDGRVVQRPVTAAPFAIRWHTAATADGLHTLSARVLDVDGRVSDATRIVRVRNPAPPMTCFVVQRDVRAAGRGAVVTRPLRTAVAGETLLAMVSAGGPAGQRVRVHGAGLAWHLVGRANALAGDAEVWSVVVPRVTGGIRVHAVPRIGGHRELLTVVALEGVARTGAVTARSGVGGSATARVRTTGDAASLVFAVGTSRRLRAATTGGQAPALPVGQIFAGRGKTSRSVFWSQYTNTAVSPSGTRVTMTARASGAWNFIAVEAVGDDG